MAKHEQNTINVNSPVSPLTIIPEPASGQPIFDLGFVVASEDNFDERLDDAKTLCEELEIRCRTIIQTEIANIQSFYIEISSRLFEGIQDELVDVGDNFSDLLGIIETTFAGALAGIREEAQAELVAIGSPDLLAPPTEAPTEQVGVTDSPSPSGGPTSSVTAPDLNGGIPFSPAFPGSIGGIPGVSPGIPGIPPTSEPARQPANGEPFQEPPTQSIGFDPGEQTTNGENIDQIPPEDNLEPPTAGPVFEPLDVQSPSERFGPEEEKKDCPQPQEKSLRDIPCAIDIPGTDYANRFNEQFRNLPPPTPRPEDEEIPKPIVRIGSVSVRRACLNSGVLAILEGIEELQFGFLGSPLTSGQIGIEELDLGQETTVTSPYTVMNKLFSGLDDLESSDLNKIWSTIKEFSLVAPYQGIEAAMKGAGCTNSGFLSNTAFRSVLGFSNYFAGGQLDDSILPYKQGARWLCPMDLPTPEEANAAWLTNEIDDKTWECWTRANNQQPNNWFKILRSNRAQLPGSVLTELWRRKKFGTAQLRQRLRQIGYIEESDPGEFIELSKFIPPISDLVRFMVRDVEDDNIVDRFGLDEDFSLKWRGQTALWGDNQGIDREQARRYWRSHWRVPSPTQLFEMFHRLRDLPDDDPAKTSIEDVRTALKQDDWLPFWIERMIQTSFRRLTRVDIRRAFAVGAITREEVVKTYKTWGYDDNNAEILAKFMDKLGFNRALRLPLSRMFRDNTISEDDYRREMAGEGFNNAQMAPVVTRILLEQQAEVTKECVKGIHQKFNDAGIDEIGAKTEIIKLGLDVQQADNLVDAWKCRLRSSPREPQAAQLCKWMEQGLLTALEMFNRLRLLGYTAEDTERILNSCDIQIQEKERKLLAKKAKEAEAARKKLERENARKTSKTKKQTKQQKDATEALRKQREATERKLIATAEKWAKKSERQLDDAFVDIRKMVSNAERRFVMSKDQIIAFIDSVVDLTAKKEPAELEGEVTKALVASQQG